MRVLRKPLPIATPKEQVTTPVSSVVVQTEVLPVKSVIISGEIHEMLKNFCKMKNLKISGFVESLISNYISNKKKTSAPTE